VDGNWEVGLTEISIPARIENVVGDECYFELYIRDEFVAKITLPSGEYFSGQLVIHNLNRKLRIRYPNAEDPMIVFRHRDVGHRVMMRILNAGPRVRFSANLARILGLQSNKFYSSPEESARKSVDLTQHIHSAYVYCDSLEHVTVEDTKAPLLRIVDFPKNNTHTEECTPQVELCPLHTFFYKNVLRYDRNQRITDPGIPVQFVSGKSFVASVIRSARVF